MRQERLKKEMEEPLGFDLNPNWSVVNGWIDFSGLERRRWVVATQIF